MPTVSHSLCFREWLQNINSFSQLDKLITMGEGVVFKRQVFTHIQTFVVPNFIQKKITFSVQLNHFTFTILLKAIHQVLLFYLSHKN